MKATLAPSGVKEAAPLGSLSCAFRSWSILTNLNPLVDAAARPGGQRVLCSSDHAVVWDAEGRGACGAHHRLLVIGAKP